MSETTYLKLFKHDNPSTNENQFDVDKSLNDNWDKLDNFAGDVNQKVQEIEGNIAEQEQEITYVKEELETEINELQKDIQANSIIEETEQAKSLYINDATNSRGKISAFGNVEQETSTASANLLDTYLFEEKTVNGITLTKKENGAIVLNGTATAQTLFEAKLKQSISKNGYIFKIAKVSGTVSAGNIQFFLYTDGYTANKNIAVTTNVNSANTTLDNNTYTIERIVIPNGTVLSNVEINAMVSETDTSYVSFTPDMPSIDYPSKIATLGSNKNLFNINGTRAEQSTGECSYCDGKITITKVGPIRIIVDGLKIGKSYILSWGNGNINSIQTVYTSSNTDIDRNYNMNSSTKFIASESTVTVSILNTEVGQYIENLKLEVGETTTTYSPYRTR